MNLALFLNRKDYDGYLLQNRLHFKIHAALQEIKYRQKQNKKAAKKNNTDKCQESDSGSVVGLQQDGVSLQGSESSFETAPEQSSDDDCVTEKEKPQNIFMETTV